MNSKNNELIIKIIKNKVKIISKVYISSNSFKKGDVIQFLNDIIQKIKKLD